MTLLEAVMVYKKDRGCYKELQALIDKELMPGILQLFWGNRYQPDTTLCSISQLIASLVAKELEWGVGSIDRLHCLDEEDLRQELYLVIYRTLDTWKPEMEFDSYFIPVLVGALVDWYSMQRQ